MPALLSQPSVSAFHSPKSLPANVWNTFESDPRNSNIVYAHALKIAQKTDGFSGDDQLWIACSTGAKTDFVLSCTHHLMGDYPIFIYCARPPSHNTPEFVLPRMQLLAKELLQYVDPERVFSIFSLDQVTRMFADTWRNMTQISYYNNPYYAAKITYCTKATLRKPRQNTLFSDISYELRLATQDDIPQAARLCYGFAKEAEPFVLTMEQAMQEATNLVSQQQLWVHTILAEGARDKPAEIASIVAVTRESRTVAAITKVYTNPGWRSRKCAMRLVRQVTQSLLASKESVILYVAHDNPAASKVYQNVGFVGLAKSSSPVEGVDSWTELGFDRAKVELGHW